ncbi:hypothetical protein CCACVL1_25335, partial [Corchorus capsularis]
PLLSNPLSLFLKSCSNLSPQTYLSASSLKP